MKLWMILAFAALSSGTAVAQEHSDVNAGVKFQFPIRKLAE